MEEALRRERDFSSAVVETEGALVVVLDPRGRIVRFNRACEQTTGYSFDEVRNQYFWDLFLIPEEVEQVKAVFEQLRAGNFPNETENYWVTKDGRLRLITWSNTVLLDHHRSVEYIIGTGIDITERKQAEEELRKHRDHLEELVLERTDELISTVEQLQKEISERKRSEEELQFERAQLLSIFDSINEIIYVADPKTYEILYANKTLRDSFKKNPIGGICYREFQGLESPCEFCTNEIILKEKNKTYQWEYHNPILDKDFIITDRIIKWPDGHDVRFEIAIDITERKKAEELARLQQQQLMQADKMATLGILSSGVAHEINNPNNFILLNAKIFQRVWNDVTPILEEYYQEYGDFALAGMPYTQAHEKIGQLIAGMSEGAQRIAKIVKGLKDFAGQDTGDLNQAVDINSVVEAAILIVSNLIKKSTNRFSCEYVSNLPKIRGNAQQLEQVVINLITNACQALQDKEAGLFISTSYDSNSNNVIVKVRDEGIGILPEQLKRIMDPFFTTKRASGGTGLGLSISYNIVKAHGGILNFTSEFEKGTTVILTLPVH
jgi:PAS domain S-box-containing protein